MHKLIAVIGLLFILLLFPTTRTVTVCAEEKSASPPSGSLSREEKEIVEMMELLELLELLRNMELIADYDIISKDEENDEKDG